MKPVDETIVDETTVDEISFLNCRQDIATHRNILHHCNTLQHTATHCNTLQHTATHCNTLQNLMAIIVDETSFLDCRHSFRCSPRSLCAVTWLIHMCPVTWLIHMCTVTWLIHMCTVTWLIHRCSVNHSRLNLLWHDSSSNSLYLFIRNVTWLIDMCDMTCACEWYASFLCDTTLVTWLVHEGNMWVKCLIAVWHDASISVTWRFYECDTTDAAPFWKEARRNALASRHAFSFWHAPFTY